MCASVARRLALSLLCLACATLLAGCPLTYSSFFRIKFVNTGTEPVIGAYLVASTTGELPSDWGPNLLPAAQLANGQLENLEYVVFGDYFPRGAYWMKVTFLVDGVTQDYFDDEAVEPHMDTAGLTEDYLTWYAGYTVLDGGGYSAGTGYNYGIESFEGETEAALVKGR